MLIGIDVGFGYTKAVAGNGRQISFPSVIAPRRGTGELGRLLGGEGPKHALDIEEQHGAGPQYLWVGEAAVSADGTRTWDDEAARRGDYDRLVLAALALLGAEGSVAIVVGVPLAMYANRDGRRALRDRLERLEAWVGVDGETARLIRVVTCRVYPQGVGAYISALNSAGGDGLANQPVGLIDVGYRTTDYLLLEPVGGVPVPNEDRSGSLDRGIGAAYDQVRASLGAMASLARVESALLNGGLLTYQGTQRDLRPAFEAAARELAEAVSSHLERAWATQLPYLGGILLAGGGGQALAGYLPTIGRTTTQVVQEPAFANARGYLLLAQGAGTRG